VEERGREKVTDTEEAKGVREGMPSGLTGGVEGGRDHVTLLPPKLHPMPLLLSVELSQSTLSTGVSCQATEVSREPGLGATVREVGAAREARERGEGWEGLALCASSSMDWQE